MHGTGNCRPYQKVPPGCFNAARADPTANIFMNKQELIDIVSKKTGIKKDGIGTILEMVLNAIIDELVKGGEVNFTGFGLFYAKTRTARMGVHPRTQEKMQIPETRTPKFRPGKDLKGAVKK